MKCLSFSSYLGRSSWFFLLLVLGAASSFVLGQSTLPPVSPFGSANSDYDTLTNAEEITVGTNPALTDTDGDFITDSDELSITLTNPLLADSNGDGLSDYVNWVTAHPQLWDVNRNALWDARDLQFNDYSSYQDFWWATAHLIDMDGDGISDHDEFWYGNWHKYKYWHNDSDGDGILDGVEWNGPDHWLPTDYDHDGLAASSESRTDPYNPDSDGDGLPDGVDSFFRAETHADSDNDGLNDLEELLNGSSPGHANNDEDWLDDAQERILGTNPFAYDTDMDGLSDGAEFYGTLIDVGPTDPLFIDSDGDFLTDFEEQWSWYATTGAYFNGNLLDPNNPDTDGDGVLDYFEVNLTDTDNGGVPDVMERYYGLNPQLSSDDIGDLDNDGETNVVEYQNGTLLDGNYGPRYDWDRDGMTNVWEIAQGLDPTDPLDAYDDPDGDYLFNIEEYQARTDPQLPLTPGAQLIVILTLDPTTFSVVHIPARTDYEAAMRSALPAGLVRGNGPDAQREHEDDWDGDGLTNRSEMLDDPFTSPRTPTADADGDSLPSAWEISMTLNPLNGDQNTSGTNDRDDDFDQDTLTNHAELLAGTHPLNSDTDADGLPDGWEISFGLNPLDASGDQGGAGDVDGDGLTNEEEQYFGRDPTQNVADLRGDKDMDGVPDYRDAVDYDPAFTHAPSGIPRYAFVDLGPGGNFKNMANNGRLLWQRSYVDSTTKAYSRWAPWEPARHDFTVTSATKPPGAYSFEPQKILSDGRLYGIGKETSQIERLGVLDPVSGTSSWLAPLDPQQGIQLYSFDLRDYGEGPGNQIHATASYNYSHSYGEEWLAFIRNAGGSPQFENHTKRNDGVYHYRRINLSGLGGVIREKSDGDFYQFELVTESAVIPLVGYDQHIDDVSYTFIHIAPTSQPWLIAFHRDYENWANSGHHLYKPNQAGTAWLPHSLYASEADFVGGLPLTNLELTTAQKQVFFSPTGGFEGIWADGNYEEWRINNPYFSDYGSLKFRDVSQTGIVALEATVSGLYRLLAGVPVDFGISTEDILVPADVGQVDLPTYFEGIEEHVLGGRVSWQIVQGTGGTLSQQTAELGAEDEPDADTTLTTSHVSGQTYRVQANLTEIKMGDRASPAQAVWLPSSLKASSGIITVAPGEAASVNLVSTSTTPTPADGTTSRLIYFQVQDAFGNPLPAGVPVFWRLKGDGEIYFENTETSFLGYCSCYLRSGRVPGPQTVIVEVDTLRWEQTFTNVPLNVDLTPGQVQTEFNEGIETKTFDVTVSATAAAASPVRWSTTQGIVVASQTALQSNGTATATIRVQMKQEAGGSPVVVTASVAESMGIASVVLAPLSMTLAATQITPEESTVMSIDAPLLAGREIRIRSQRTHAKSTLYSATEVADGVVSSSPQPTAPEFGVEVTWTRPSATASPAFEGAVLLQNSIYTLSVGPEGKPTLVLNPGTATPTTVSITDSAAVVAPGESATIYWSMGEGSKVSVSSKGRKAEALLPGPPPSGSTHEVPTASTELIGSVKLRSRVDTSAPVPATDVRSVKLAQSDDELTLTLPPSGVTTVSVKLPDDQITEGSDKLKLVIETIDSAPPDDPPLPQHIVTYTVPIMQASPIGGPNLGMIADASAALWTGVEYDNRAATASELVELERYAHAATARAAATGFETDLADLSPPAFGGDLDHQATQGKDFLAMAKTIDSAITGIEALARRMDVVTVTNGEGKKLFQMDTAIGARSSMLVGRNGLEQWLESGKLKMASALEEAGDAALGAAVGAFQSTMSWTHTTLVAAKLDNVPLIRDADKLVQQLTEEGLVDYMKAMARLTLTMQANPQAAGLYLISQLEGIIQPPLDAWAAGGGESEKVAVAGAGMIAYCVQTGSMIASSACDEAAIRRMAAQALGTIISAAVGSTAARNELEEMIPFWSWLVMGEQVADYWQTAQYYQSGKRAAELVVQVVGDVTILIPVVKGAQIAVKGFNGVTKASIRQALSRVNYTFTRKKQKDPEGVTETITHCLDHPAENIGCFPKGTLVLLGDGSWKTIETLKAEELVMADDPRDSLPPAPRGILDVLENRTEQLCEVKTAGGSVSATSDHPFWVQGSGWTAAADLNAGMTLTTPDHKTVTVNGISLQDTKCGTWNLTVADSHSFFVKSGDDAVLVHNTKPGARVYVVYEVPLPSGKVYVGRCSLPWDGVSSVEEGAKKAIRRRFARHHRAAIHDGFLEKNAKAKWHEIYDASDYNKKQTIYGTMRGVEHRLEEHWAAQGKSANRDTPGWKKPIDDNNPNRTTYINKADVRGIRMCPKR